MITTARQIRYTGVIAVVTLAVFVASCTGSDTSQAPAEGQAPATQAPAINPLLAGAIDFHTHTLPDMQPRSMDAIELAKVARARGMRGLVLKNHFISTAGFAHIVRTEVPGIEVFGGIDLNLPVGGINIHAVEHMLKMTGGWGRVVWFPTSNSEYGARGRDGGPPKPPYVSVARNGQLLPEVKQVIGIIAKNNLVLETGHSSPEESLMLVKEGKAQGVQNMLVTHAAGSMSVEQMQEATKSGAYIEWIYGNILTTEAIGRKARWSDPDYAAMIRKVGVEWSVLATDLGQFGNVLPVDGMEAFIERMSKAGFTKQELDRMAKDNPAKLLGLSPYTTSQ